jgi:hypothetical protein
MRRVPSAVDRDIQASAPSLLRGVIVVVSSAALDLQ